MRSFYGWYSAKTLGLDVPRGLSARADKVIELASATGSLGPANQGSAMLKTLRDKEGGS